MVAYQDDASLLSKQDNGGLCTTMAGPVWSSFQSEAKFLGGSTRWRREETQRVRARSRPDETFQPIVWLGEVPAQQAEPAFFFALFSRRAKTPMTPARKIDAFVPMVGTR